MSIDDKVSAKRWRFFFSVFSRYWSETHSSVKKVKSVLKPIPQLKYSKHKFEKNRSTVYFQFFLWTLFSNAHFSEYIETACRCSLRIHSRAKWYRFFGNFHLKRELMYEILSSSLSYCSLSLSLISHIFQPIRSLQTLSRTIRVRSLYRSPFGKRQKLHARALYHPSFHSCFTHLLNSNFFLSLNMVEFSICNFRSNIRRHFHWFDKRKLVTWTRQYDSWIMGI